jgi:hypothetical protein
MELLKTGNGGNTLKGGNVLNGGYQSICMEMAEKAKNHEETKRRKSTIFQKTAENSTNSKSAENSLEPPKRRKIPQLRLNGGSR